MNTVLVTSCSFSPKRENRAVYIGKWNRLTTTIASNTTYLVGCSHEKSAHCMSSRKPCELEIIFCSG